MSKITVGVPPIFSPLLCPQKSWEKIDCQIEQHKKHTYNIKTIGPFFFLNPTNKKNYPFLLFLPNYTPEPLPKKCNSCTLTIKFSKFIPSMTFLSTREDQIREIYDYITQSKEEVNVFLENVKISENITSMDFYQYSENLNKPIKVIPNIQFMNGKWQLQTLYKEQAKELKTILIESQKVIALPCFEIPHKFGSNDIAIYSFFVMSRTDPFTVYFKTPEIDEMIKWILFIYAYLHNSPNAVGAPFPRMQTMPIKKSAIFANQQPPPISTTENHNDSNNNIRSSRIINQSPKPNPNSNQKPNPNPNQKPNPNPNQKPTSMQPQKATSSQQQKITSSQPQRPQRQAQISASASTDSKRKQLERKPSNQTNSSNRPIPASQMNIRKPTQPSATISKTPSKGQNNLSQSQNQNSPKPGNRTSRILSNTSSMSSIPEMKITNTNDNKINISTSNSSVNNTITTNNNINDNNSNEINNLVIKKSQNTSNANNEPEKEEFQAFSFTFESVDIDKTSKKANIEFPSVQFVDPDKIQIDENDKQENSDKNQNQQSTTTTSDSTQKQPITTIPVATMQSRARSFSVKRRNSSISSEALDCIRSDKSHDFDDNDDYKIPRDIESRIENSITELDKKYSNIVNNNDKKADIFHPPDYKDIISSTLVSVSTLTNSNSKAMQIKTLLSTIENDTQKDVIDFPFVDQEYEKTVEETLSTMSSEDNINLSSYFKFNEYPEYDVNQLTNPARPRNNFIDEFTFIDQGLRQSGSMNLDLNNSYVVRLCFLVACTIVNGLKEFNDQYSTVSIVEPFRQLSLVLSDLNPIINEINDVQTTCEQASIAATMLIKKNLLGTFLREVKRTDNWAPKYYLRSAMLSSYEFIDTFVLMLEPMLNTMSFNVEISSTIFKSVSLDDANRYAFTPLFSYLEIDDLFKIGTDPVKIISKQFENGLKKSKKFLNSSAWDVLEKLSQDQRYAAAYYAKFMNSINASKAFFGSSKSKLESWVSEAINSKMIHAYFMLVHINLTLLNTPEYYEESSLIDPFRANYIMKKLCKFVSRP